MLEKVACNVRSPWHTMLCNSKQYGNRQLIVSHRYVISSNKGLDLWQASINQDYKFPLLLEL